MPKIVIIGAGSVGFTRRLVNDILTFPELAQSTFVLVDIDPARLELISRLMERLVKQEGLKAKFQATTARRKALKNADYVIITIQVGGLKAYKYDVEIPLKYGIDQCVGDTLGPGGVFRGLRTVPILTEICRDMEELCPNAFLMNYANPMAINCWAMEEVSPIKKVGLCHGVQGTAAFLAKFIGAPMEEIEYWVAGINHMAWFLRFEWQGKDAYPLIWKKLRKSGPPKAEKYRFEMMKAVGYFMTESSGHLSEYIPYFRKRKDLLKRFNAPGFGGETKAYYKMCVAGLQKYLQEIERQIKGKEPVPFVRERSVEYASNIIHAMETGEIFRFNGNVKNAYLIENLPMGSCVEVPCFVDKIGLHPCTVGKLPSICAALNRTNINVQELTVKAALTGDRELAYQAVLMDPLTAAVLSPQEIRRMVDEMFRKEAKLCRNLLQD